MFLKFLIRSLRTINGKRGTANKLIAELNKRSLSEYKEKYKRYNISESTRIKIIHANEHKVFYSTYFKYLIMRIRAKISYICLEKRMTVVELFAHTILKCLR